MRRFMILITTLGLLAGACGNDGGTSLSGLGSSDDFCDSNAEIEARLDGIDFQFQDAFSSGDFSSLGAYFEEALELMRGAAIGAPSEIRGDIDTLVGGFQTFVDVLDDYDYNFLEIPEDEPRLAALDDPEFDAASDRVSAYCGIDPDSDSSTDVGDTPDSDPDQTPDPDPGDVTDDDSGVTDDDTGISDDEITDIVAQALAESFGIELDLARCIVEEAGLSSPAAIDASAFEDLSAPICGTTWGAVLGFG